jgi:hypothetical protein
VETFVNSGEDLGYGKLVLSHRTVTGAPAEYFDQSEQYSCVWNTVDQAPHKFSRLIDLERLRAADDAFYFTLVYPNDKTPGLTVFRWKQTRYSTI